MHPRRGAPQAPAPAAGDHLPQESTFLLLPSSSSSSHLSLIPLSQFLCSGAPPDATSSVAPSTTWGPASSFVAGSGDAMPGSIRSRPPPRLARRLQPSVVPLPRHGHASLLSRPRAKSRQASSPEPVRLPLHRARPLVRVDQGPALTRRLAKSMEPPCLLLLPATPATARLARQVPASSASSRVLHRANARPRALTATPPASSPDGPCRPHDSGEPPESTTPWPL